MPSVCFSVIEWIKSKLKEWNSFPPTNWLMCRQSTWTAGYFSWGGLFLKFDCSSTVSESRRCKHFIKTSVVVTNLVSFVHHFLLSLFFLFSFFHFFFNVCEIIYYRQKYNIKILISVGVSLIGSCFLCFA